MRNTLILLFFFLIDFAVYAQLKPKKGKVTMYYMDRVNDKDLKGRSIIEFIPASFKYYLKTKKGIAVTQFDYEGFLVTHKTSKGKDLGIRGINIESSETGELKYLEIGVIGGLQIEEINDDQLLLKGPKIKSDNIEYDQYYLCIIK